MPGGEGDTPRRRGRGLQGEPGRVTQAMQTNVHVESSLLKGERGEGEGRRGEGREGMGGGGRGETGGRKEEFFSLKGTLHQMKSGHWGEGGPQRVVQILT